MTPDIIVTRDTITIHHTLIATWYDVSLTRDTIR